jgi:hypothetical protein
MKSIVTIVAVLALLGSAHAGEVFVTKDAKGQVVYTDRPESLPAEKLKVSSKSTDTAEVANRYDTEMKGHAAADAAAANDAKKAADAKQVKEMTAVDKAKRCEESRQRYEHYMNAQRLYEPGESEGERHYLDDDEITAARDNAKKTMDEFCTGL